MQERMTFSRIGYAQSFAKELKGQGANLIVALAHLDFVEDMELIAQWHSGCFAFRTRSLLYLGTTGITLDGFWRRSEKVGVMDVI